MDEVELFEIKYFLLTLNNMLGRYAAMEPFEAIVFTPQEELLSLLDPSGRRLPTFSVEDSYSPELAAVRREKTALEEVLRGLTGEAREEPLNRRRLLALKEDELELGVRRTLTARVLAEKQVLLANMEAVGKLDFLLAKARLARRFGYITVAFGSGLMAVTGVIMFIICPLVFRLLTPVVEVREVAAQILRIGLIAEPLYGASMVASGALRGAEDTLVPSLLNLFSIWVVRLGLALILVPLYGIHGMWTAMAIELCVRGLLLFGRQLKSKYLRPDAAKER
jgi:hypothetical protein